MDLAELSRKALINALAPRHGGNLNMGVQNSVFAACASGLLALC